MVDDVLINKAGDIERAVRRIREVHAGDDAGLKQHQTRQDAVVLNLQRACESSVDAAMHLVRIHRLGVPQETREAFDLIERGGLIEPVVAERMRKMVEFRHLAVHNHRELSLDVVMGIVSERLDHFLEFTTRLLRLGAGGDPPRASS